MGWITGLGRSPGWGNGNPLKYSCLESPMNRGALAQFSLVTQSCPTICAPVNCSTPGFPVHHQLPELAQIHVHPTISSSVIPFSSRLQSFPAPGSFPMTQFFTSVGQIIGASASTSWIFNMNIAMNIHDWFPLGLTGWISWQSKWLSRVFSNTTVQKHQFFDTQLSL